MEVLSSSFLSPTPSLTTLTKKTRLKLNKTHLKSSPNSPFCTTNSPLINPKNSRIIARFGRPTKRRNSLRKKLIRTDNESQVIRNPSKFIDPVQQFVDNNQASEFNLDSVSLGIDGGKVGSLENGSKKIGESVLWDKLENWVDLYKKDIEFWGIGSNPIFTVFQDSSNGRVDKVFVDEDEILKRSGVDPVYFKEVSELEEFSEVNSKISHARFLARELESGRDVIPRNSSVAKFLVSGAELGLISRIRSLSVPQNVVIKASRVSVAVVCGVLFVWTVKKLLNLGGNGMEVTKLEKEMLRRKMKARVEKEKTQKGSVEIVEEPSESPVVITQRPQLDKEAVLDGIRKAKGLSSDLALVDAGGAQGSPSTEMDFRIKEIQMMARRAREIERGEDSATEEKDLDKGNPNELRDKSAEAVDSVEIHDFDKYATAEHVEGQVDHGYNLPSENFTEARVINGIAKTDVSDCQESTSSDSVIPDKEVYKGIDKVELQSGSSEKNSSDEKSPISSGDHCHDSSKPLDSSERSWSDASSSKMSPLKKAPVRRMPKIIRSVKEAREYLSLKNDQKAQVSDVIAITAATNEETESYVSQGLGEDDKALVSSNVEKILDSDPAVNVFVSNAAEEMETDFSRLNKEPPLEIGPLNPEMDKVSSVDIELGIGRTGDTDEMFKHSNLCETSEAVSNEDTTYDASTDVYKYPSSAEWLDKVDDETPKPTDLSETLDLSINSSHDVDTSGGVSDIQGESPLHYANFQEMVHHLNEGPAEVNGFEETPRPSTLSEISEPLHTVDDLDGSGPEESSLTDANDFEHLKKTEVESNFLPAGTCQDSETGSANNEGGLFADKESWLEKNFHEVQPIVNKIGAGFRDSYVVAREKGKQEASSGLDFMDLSSVADDTELEWMKDDKLREIVFRVRDNELSGRDPFHSMDLDDKAAFFKGLESKVEKENQKLSSLHQWLHSNIENIDYGADGISIYDPPEKVIPKWKGPPLDDFPEFLSNSRDQQRDASSLQKSDPSTEHGNTGTSQQAFIAKSRPKGNIAKFSKTVIETSDGSMKPGKKSGKEHWQHTKKWSRGFVESYNAETDPEVKSTMKDIGKGLDRWITEKEIKEAADLMEKLPQRGKEIIDKKINKLKREMEMFGPQAVVSKYREYADERDEDYLWWLDLPHVLCIELYTFEGEDQEVGFYTLEMAEDLELEPKPQHVIAFQDPGDCKNFCYIIQAHLEMLGKGKAFIVPQHPKDAFRLAKANGFGVTVIRKGELQLNVDQPLEEVEELISEIGSKIYHDKITKERSVDISSLMKGVFGFNRPIKRKRKKRSRKRPSKS